MGKSHENPMGFSLNPSPTVSPSRAAARWLWTAAAHASGPRSWPSERPRRSPGLRGFNTG
jgi:hypothetical protein